MEFITLIKYDKICILKNNKNNYIKWQYDDLIIEKFEKDLIPKINKEIIIYDKSFLMHHRYYDNFKHFTETFNILDSYLRCKDNKRLVLNNSIYIKIKPIIEILNIDIKNIIILQDYFKYKFLNLTYNNINNDKLYDELNNLSIIKTLIDNIESSKNLNYTKYNKIYLKRGLLKRGPINENLLINFLKEKNFKILKFTNDTNILEQIYTIYYADEIIAPIGAGCNNIIFKNETCYFKCLIPDYWGYRGWADIYKRFENYKIIKCGSLCGEIQKDCCNTDWVLNENCIHTNILNS